MRFQLQPAKAASSEEDRCLTAGQQGREDRCLHYLWQIWRRSQLPLARSQQLLLRASPARDQSSAGSACAGPGRSQEETSGPRVRPREASDVVLLLSPSAWTRMETTPTLSVMDFTPRSAATWRLWSWAPLPPLYVWSLRRERSAAFLEQRSDVTTFPVLSLLHILPVPFFSDLLTASGAFVHINSRPKSSPD